MRIDEFMTFDQIEEDNFLIIIQILTDKFSIVHDFHQYNLSQFELIKINGKPNYFIDKEKN